MEGTVAEISIQTDRPLATGAILLDDASQIQAMVAGLKPGLALVNKEFKTYVDLPANDTELKLTETFNATLVPSTTN